MRKIIGIGETILDIIFQNQQPTAAVPGGSVFNSIISLGRLGCDVTMITETGNDRVGKLILDFMEQNGVNNRHVAVYHDGRSAISLAWLNERNDAEYMFYKDYPAARLDVDWPDIQPDDIVLMGSYFVLNPALREKTREFIALARSKGAVIYYDLNFRATHRDEVVKIYADVLENMEAADIVRGSTEDLANLFPKDNAPAAVSAQEAERIYRNEIAYHCPNFICTDAGSDVLLFTQGAAPQHFPVEKIQTVSTIGAGDNFNAGIAYALLRERICRDDIAALTPALWQRIIQTGKDLAAEACKSLNNSISPAFAAEYKMK